MMAALLVATILGITLLESPQQGGGTNSLYRCSGQLDGPGTRFTLHPPFGPDQLPRSTDHDVDPPNLCGTGVPGDSPGTPATCR